MQEIVVLTKSEFVEIIKQAGEYVAQILREDMERSRLREVMTKVELADYWRCSPSHINNLMRSKGLPYALCGTHIRFFREEVDTWLKSQRNKSS